MIFFDFDGTLVDVWKRYFAVFCAAAQTDNLVLEDYISVKRQLCKDDFVAEAFHIQLPEDYYRKKKELLEDPTYLAMDHLIPEVSEVLHFFDSYDCRILTMRRQEQAFHGQLQALGLGSLATRSIVLDPAASMSKKDFLSGFCTSQIVLLGDSFAEYEAAENPHTVIYLVETGLRDPKDFPPLQNCKIISDVSVFIRTHA